MSTLQLKTRNIVPFQIIEKKEEIHLKADGTIDKRYGHKENRTGKRCSTSMECLYTREEILAIYQVFKNKVDYAATFAKERIARRNLCMFVCSINIGLRGGDFCSLKWKDIMETNWEYKINADFIPQKTTKYDKGRFVKGKHISLIWNSDFETALSQYLEWKRNNESEPKLENYIFISQKGGHIQNKEWWKIIEEARQVAGIQQKIGTHGLRKTMAYQYITNAEDAREALIEVSSQFGHSDLRITERYACIQKERIKENKEKMSFIFETNNDEREEWRK